MRSSALALLVLAACSGKLENSPPPPAPALRLTAKARVMDSPPKKVEVVAEKPKPQPSAGTPRRWRPPPAPSTASTPCERRTAVIPIGPDVVTFTDCAPSDAGAGAAPE